MRELVRTECEWLLHARKKKWSHIEFICINICFLLRLFSWNVLRLSISIIVRQFLLYRTHNEHCVVACGVGASFYLLYLLPFDRNYRYETINDNKLNGTGEKKKSWIHTFGWLSHDLWICFFFYDGVWDVSVPLSFIWSAEMWQSTNFVIWNRFLLWLQYILCIELCDGKWAIRMSSNDSCRSNPRKDSY